MSVPGLLYPQGCLYCPAKWPNASGGKNRRKNKGVGGQECVSDVGRGGEYALDARVGTRWRQHAGNVNHEGSGAGGTGGACVSPCGGANYPDENALIRVILRLKDTVGNVRHYSRYGNDHAN